MNHRLTAAGYELTKERLQQMHDRLAALEARPDLSEDHKKAVAIGCWDLIRSYTRELQLYEAEQETMNGDGPSTAARTLRE